MKTVKKSIAVLLACLMFSGIMPVFGIFAFADGEEELSIEPDQSITVDCGAGEIVYIRFECQQAATYIFTSDVNGDTYGYVYDADMNQLAYDDDNGVNANFRIRYAFEANTVYYLGVKWLNSSVSGEIPVKFIHAHLDENGDTKCDICGIVFVYYLTEDVPFEAEIPENEERDFIFECPKTGSYVFSVYSEGEYSYGYIYNSSGGNIGSVNYSVFLTEGETYTCRVKSNTTSVTVTVRHSHIDEDPKDNTCDICDAATGYILAEDVVCSADIPIGEQREFFFTCSRTGKYIFKVNGTNGWNYGNIYNSSGSYAGYVNNAVSMTEGEIYSTALSYNSTYHASTTVTVTVTHDHIDENGDNACDICDLTYKYVLTEGTPLTAEIPSGEQRSFVFTCPRTGNYRFNVSGGYSGGNIYDSSGYHAGYINGTVSLTEGETYSAVLSYNSSSGESSNVTVTVNHNHIDENSDNICDICDLTYKYVLTEGTPLTAEIPAGEQKEFVFTCARTGNYRFNASGTKGYNDGNIYNSSGNYTGYVNNNVSLTEGETYTVTLSHSVSYIEPTAVTVTVTHTHTDEDGDNKCDICDLTYRYVLAEDTPLTVEIPNNEQREFFFTCARTGNYRFTASGTNSYNDGNIYNSSGNYVGTANNTVAMTEGETYTLALSYISSDYESTAVTVAVIHSHIDKNGDNKCDVCGVTYKYVITEGTPLTLEIPNGEQKTVTFTCEKTGKYKFNYTSTHGYSGGSIYDSAGNYAGWFGDKFDLTAGKTYTSEFSFESSEYESTTLTLTVNHVHIEGEDTRTVAEPTAGGMGVAEATCTMCGEKFRYPLDNTGEYTTDETHTSGGYEYYILADGDDREIILTGFDETVGPDMVIPSEINGIPVAGIYFEIDEETEISMRTRIKSLSIPDSVTTIYPDAFVYFSGLDELTIPDSVAVIGDEAFAACVGLNSVNLGKGVKYIGEGAFWRFPEDEIEEIENELDYIKQELVDEINEECDKQFDNLEDALTFLENSDNEEYRAIAAMFRAQMELYDTALNNKDGIDYISYAGTEEEWNEIWFEDENEGMTEAETYYDGGKPHTHDYVPEVTPPTCTEEGYTTYTCSCGDSYVEDRVPANGHSFTDYVSDGNATCLEDGTKTAKCDNCDETDTVKDEGSAKGHSFTNYVYNNNATYEADGTQTAKCDRCDATDTKPAPGTKLIDPMAGVTISATEGTKEINWKYRAKITATASGLGEGYKVVWFEGSNKVSDGGEFTTGSLTSEKTYTAKVIDAGGKVVSNSAQEKTVTIKVKSGFFDKIISFFLRLFGSDIVDL